MASSTALEALSAWLASTALEALSAWLAFTALEALSTGPLMSVAVSDRSATLEPLTAFFFSCFVPTLLFGSRDAA